MQAQAVEALLASGANLHAAATDDTNSLHFAAQKGHRDVASLLLAKGSLRLSCWCQLAGCHGRILTTAALCGAGANVKSKTRKGMSALHFAAAGGEPAFQTWWLKLILCVHRVPNQLQYGSNLF